MASIYIPSNASEDAPSERPARRDTKSLFAKVKTFLFVACCIALVCMEIVTYTTQTSRLEQETNATMIRVRNTIDNILLSTLMRTSRGERDIIEIDPPVNASCDRMFRIPDSDKRIAVCTYQGRVRVDMRVWLGEKPTIKGVYFSAREYFELSKLTDTLTDEVRVQERIAEKTWQPERVNSTRD